MATSEREKLTSAILSALGKRKVRPEVLQKISGAIAVASVRPLRVLYECCVNGGISTEDLTSRYGYNQPPRAARDLREMGFNLRTKFSKTSDNRRMAVYFIDDFNSFHEKEGRTIFSKAEKQQLVARDGSRCYYCRGTFSPNELQIDHRVPYEVAGNVLHDAEGLNALILVCSSCNRSKSWSCESCSNFAEKDIQVCQTCYWHEPASYKHVRGRKAILVNFVLNEEEAGYKVLEGKTTEEIKRILAGLK